MIHCHLSAKQGIRIPPRHVWTGTATQVTPCLTSNAFLWLGWGSRKPPPTGLRPYCIRRLWIQGVHDLVRHNADPRLRQLLDEQAGLCSRCSSSTRILAPGSAVYRDSLGFVGYNFFVDGKHRKSSMVARHLALGFVLALDLRDVARPIGGQRELCIWRPAAEPCRGPLYSAWRSSAWCFDGFFNSFVRRHGKSAPGWGDWLACFIKSCAAAAGWVRLHVGKYVHRGCGCSYVAPGRHGLCLPRSRKWSWCRVSGAQVVARRVDVTEGFRWRWGEIQHGISSGQKNSPGGGFAFKKGGSGLGLHCGAQCFLGRHMPHVDVASPIHDSFSHIGGNSYILEHSFSAPGPSTFLIKNVWQTWFKEGCCSFACGHHRAVAFDNYGLFGHIRGAGP